LDAGHNVHCLAWKIPSFAERYKTFSLYNNLDQLYELIKLHKDADIFHVHNEPSWFVTAVKSVLPDKPVVLDAHDSMLIRVKPEDTKNVRISVDERNNFQLADGLVFVSEPMREACMKEFGLTQPHVVLPSYVPKELYRLDSWKWIGGIVYEGRIDLPDEIGTEELAFFAYCDYTKLAEELTKRDIPLHLYTPRKDGKTAKHYEGKAFWRGSYPYTTLIRKIGRHNWGLVGNLGEHMVWQYAMPNKLFEYLAAGIPIIALNADRAGDFVEEHGFGIKVSTVDEIVDRWAEHRQCRQNVTFKRFDWCMDNHIHKIEELYKKLT